MDNPQPDVFQAKLQLAEISKDHCNLKTTIEHWEQKLAEARQQLDRLNLEVRLTERMMMNATQFIRSMEENRIAPDSGDAVAWVRT